jgi:YD repeat-containing protein
VCEVARLLRDELPQRGLVLDVRGNPGGKIGAGERLLQLLSPRRIEPEKLHFINTPATREVAARLLLTDVAASIVQGLATGADFSLGRPLERADAYNDIGQCYQGPVVLVVDALCYSTTEIFAAGFQDHGVGLVLGTAERTGGGGANAWTYGALRDVLGGRDPERDERLSGTSFTVAVRRTERVGSMSGVLLEDVGVRADEVHPMTRGDVLHRNVDLVSRALEYLRSQPGRRLRADYDASGRRLAIERRHVPRVDVYLDDRPFASLDEDDPPALDLGAAPGRPARATLQGWEPDGFGRARLVASFRLALRDRAAEPESDVSPAGSAASDQV